jgi:predicted MFS family arabinose efflux permease
MNPNLLLLTFAQGAFLTNNVVFIAINGLVGLALAPQGWMATFPVSAYVIGAALSAQLVAKTQRLYGRKRSFQLGLCVGLLSALVCAYAAYTKQFWLLTASTLVAGYYNANASLYRFAAPELVGSNYKEKAISWVMAGGIIGAVLGPNLANWTRSGDFAGMALTNFVGSYLVLAVVALIGLALISNINFPPLSGGGKQQGRSAWQLAKQPVFVIAILCGALGFGVMNLLMASTPIAMQICGLTFDKTALVLEWHVLGMFVPSFFTGNLIKRIGVLPVLWMGVALNLICVAVALNGIELRNFLIALLALGVGWNFLFVGGTTLLTRAYLPEERTQAQAAMDTCVFATLALSSLASGVLLNTQGWTWLNWASLLPIGVCAVGLVYLARQKNSP